MRLKLIPWSDKNVPSEEALAARLKADGFDAFRWRDAPGATYEPHAHDHDESLWVIDGEITFGIGSQHYRLRVGDRLILPRGTVHTAHAGKAGATYLIGQRKG